MPEQTKKPSRVGAVNYLNSKPLVQGLDAMPNAIDLRFDLPSRLADALSNDQLDIGLIPSVEYFRDSSYQIVSDACIACCGPVLSVKVYFRTPPENVQTLALDEGSRTSAALAQVLLRERFDVSPKVETLPIGAGIESTAADAVLLIGDRAMQEPPGNFNEVWDLGQEWHQETGLPFVFAMWVSRPGVGLDEIAPLLSQARDIGVAQVNEIARREAPSLHLTEQEVVQYFEQNLHFHLGDSERKGLEHFRSLCEKHGLNHSAVENSFC